MNFLRGQVQNGSFRFSGGAISLSAGPPPGASSGSVVLGFRPEAAALTAPDAPGAIRGGVFVTEEMGNECFVFLNCEDTLITVRAGPGFRAEIGDVLGLKVDPDSVHLFDEQTGDVLRLEN